MNRIAVVMTDNGGIYWGKPVESLGGCITLQHVSQNDNNIFPTSKGKLSIPLVRVIEIIELDDTFSPIKDKDDEMMTRYADFKPNDKDDPSIADDWKME